MIEEFSNFLSIPNKSDDTANIRLNVSLIERMMAARGLNPRVMNGEKADAPSVYGEWRVPGARATYVLYAHYDGQPVTPAAWTVTSPFTPLILSARADRNGYPLSVGQACSGDLGDKRIYARSAADDKLGVMAILWGVDALRRAGATPDFNLKVFFEGQEEAGSPDLKSILQRNSALLKSDGWIIVDGPAHPSGTPQLLLGVRGDIGMQLTVYGPLRPLHSGHYGNWAPNPAMKISRLLASMVDPSGRVRVKNFYADVEPISPAERRALRKLPRSDRQLQVELGIARPDGSGRALSELLLLPSLNVNGIRSADVGGGAANVIPSEAVASIDLRLSKGNDYKRQVNKVIEHIRAQGYYVLSRPPTLSERLRHPLIARVEVSPGYNAERTSPDDPLVKMAVRKLARWRPPYVIPSSGASLPLHIFRESLGVSTATLSLANSDDNQHGEDENIRLASVQDAVDAVTAILSPEH